MARPRRRLDAYGQPLPTLRDAREPEPLYTRPTNQERRAELLALLDEALQVMLVRGWHGTLVVEIPVADGIMQEHSVERVRRRR